MPPEVRCGGGRVPQSGQGAREAHASLGGGVGDVLGGVGGVDLVPAVIEQRGVGAEGEGGGGHLLQDLTQPACRVVKGGQQPAQCLARGLWVGGGAGEVVREVGSDTEVMVDTGIRNGADIVAALALGAKFTLIGRAYLYGLMAGGRAGVDRTIEILADQVRRTMQLLQVRTVEELNPSHVTQLTRFNRVDWEARSVVPRP